MAVILVLIGLALVFLALLVSSRMTGETRTSDRIAAATAGGTGALLIGAVFRPELLPAAYTMLIACAAWFALAPPRELAPEPQPRHIKGGAD